MKRKKPSKRDTRIVAEAVSSLVSGISRLIYDEKILDIKDGSVPYERGERLLAVTLSDQWDTVMSIVGELNVDLHFGVEVLRRFEELCYEFHEGRGIFETERAVRDALLERLEWEIEMDEKHEQEHKWIILCSCCACANIVSDIQRKLNI